MAQQVDLCKLGRCFYEVTRTLSPNSLQESQHRHHNWSKQCPFQTLRFFQTNRCDTSQRQTFTQHKAHVNFQVYAQFLENNFLATVLAEQRDFPLQFLSFPPALIIYKHHVIVHAFGLFTPFLEFFSDCGSISTCTKPIQPLLWTPSTVQLSKTDSQA